MPSGPGWMNREEYETFPNMIMVRTLLCDDKENTNDDIAALIHPKGGNWR